MTTRAPVRLDPGSPPVDQPVRIALLQTDQRAALQQILEATGVFRADEIVVAMEVMDAYLAVPEEDYTALGAFTPSGQLLGFVCYGPTPCTLGTWDLYWIAVSPDAQRAGIGSRLLQEVDRRLALRDARLVIIETSSLAHYAPTRAFYERRGFQVVARVPDFYAQGDDRLIYAKRIHNH
jgi:ribosomal protein S18 acetylase RimI-like enzyme